MLAIPGYTSHEEIHRGRKCVVVRARRESDGAAVILKAPASEFPRPGEIAGLRREYEILTALDLPGVTRALALEIVRDRPILVLEDRGGISLKERLAGGPLDLRRFFEIATRLTATVGDLHRRGILHKDLNPKNILVGGTDREPLVTLLDFGISSRGSSEEQSLQHPNVLEGTIAYMSPEQTGRMNRDVDARSDLYSLGVTFYEMLTGRRPFESGDPLEVIHAQIALEPPAPTTHNPNLPAGLTAVVMKLLAKAPERRYQSAAGLAADLERCVQSLRATDTVPEFPLGRDDVAERFIIPQRLYGRDADVATLLEAFARASAASAELVLVSGYSGIGKTSLIRELYKSLPSHRGHAIAGKFDQLARDVPYDGVVQAFRGLVRQILTSNEAEIAEWKRRLLGALGDQGRIITDVIPELEVIVGPQPEVPALGPAETQNRFNLVFQHFIGVFAKPGHPLVLFLDDLQWADAATLSLLPQLLVGEASRGLLVIGAYRDNEVSPTHPLQKTIDDLAARGVPMVEVSLAPLSTGDLREFLADTLHSSRERVAPVADLVRAKTGGNPFFVTQFLRTLHQDGYIALDAARGEWRADLAAIERANITDNVVDLMGAKIQRLAPETQRVMRLAACVGNRFDLSTLADISERSPRDVANAVWEAAEQGLVVSIDKSYGFAPDLAAGVDPSSVVFRFLHDRVQQAAYAQIPEDDRRSVHLGIGRLLLQHGDLSEPGVLFETVNHLNVGRELMKDAAERARLAELNLEAGEKAKASGAYANAGIYFAAGTSLLGDDAWRDRYTMAFRLHLARAEADYLCGRFPEAEALYLSLIQRAGSPSDRTDATVQLIVLRETMSRYADAIRAGIDGLAALGMELPEDAAGQEKALREKLTIIRDRIGDRTIAGLVDLPRLTDENVHQAMKLLMAIWAPAYISGEAALSRLVPARIVRLSLEHGNCEESAFGYLHHAITIGYSFGEYERAHEFGLLAIALNDRLHDIHLRAAIHHRFAALVNAWSRPFPSCIEHAKKAARLGLESGQLQVSAYAEFQQSWYGMLLEPSIDSFHRKYAPVVDVLARMKSPAFLEAQKIILQWGAALQGRTTSATSLSSQNLDEEEFARTYARGGIFKGLLATLRLELLDTYQHVEEAHAAAERDEPAAEIFASSIWPAIFAFRHALALAAWFPTAPDAARPAALAKLETLKARLHRWADSVPENFGTMHRLVEAEVARVTGRPGDAIEGYEAALASAERQVSPRHRAHANELYGRFWYDRGQPQIAALFLREARFGYAAWGATAKVADLDTRYSDLFRRTASSSGAAAAREVGAGVLTTTATTGVALDALALARAAQAISREIELERLLERLLRVVLENAGAERGAIVLESDDGPRVLVEGSADGIRVHAGGTVPLEDGDLIVGVVNFVRHTEESVVLDDAAHDERFRAEILGENVPAYGAGTAPGAKPRSVLCSPILNQGNLIGALYIENRLAGAAFTPDRLQVMQILASQAAIAIDNARLFEEVSRLRDRLQAENVYLQTEIKTSHGFAEIVGDTPALKKVLAQVEQVAPTQTTALITGETGTGKELVARAIHRMSKRAEHALIALNCGAISPGLVESELFGHEKGAFTGAIARKIGRFELADGGTLFLDEIGDLPLDLQIKLLRVLQEGEIERVGGGRAIKVNVRVVAATHRDLAKAVAEGKFREDLFYRLNVFPIRLPALRERVEDIPLLVRHFVQVYGTKLGKRITRIPREAMISLTSYPWPGNVRELANVVERSVIVSQGDSLELAEGATPMAGAAHPSAVELEDVERDHILRVLIQRGWRVSGPQGAAQVLGLRPTTLEARMKKLGITRPK